MKRNSLFFIVLFAQVTACRFNATIRANHWPWKRGAVLTIPFRLLTAALFLFLLQAMPADAGETALSLPDEVTTFADGRKPIQALYQSYLKLLEYGWTLEIVANSEPEGTTAALPIIALHSPLRGPAVWILAGIHGEEPAGPNALAAVIEDIARLGRQRPVVLLPLLNPQGYARNWRYLNVPIYSEAIEGHSVGDSSHLLPAPAKTESPRAAAASSPEADAITAFVLRLAADYPPLYSIDLHEDNLINQGYVYSQGVLGAADPLAIEAVNVLKDNGVPLKLSGETRFGEPVVGGIISPVIDSSIDELISSKEVIVNGRLQPGPVARTVLVFETPAAALTLEHRINAHAALIRRLLALIAGSASTLAHAPSPPAVRHPHAGGLDHAAGWRSPVGRSLHARWRRGQREISGPARVPALSQARGPRPGLPHVFLFRAAWLRGRGGRHPRHRQQRRPADSLRVFRHRAAGRRGRDRLAFETALVEWQCRNVRHLLGRIQFHPDGVAQSAGLEGHHRGGCHGRQLPGGCAFHRWRHSRRFLGDEPGPRQRPPGSAGLPDRRGLFPRPLRHRALDADLQGPATRRRLLGPGVGQGPLSGHPHSFFLHRRLVRRLPRQHPAHARECEGAGEGHHWRLVPRLAA